jgi:hypothetical protein
MSTLRADHWKSRDDAKEYYGAQAWVNFNGTGTVAIRASKNVSSITDNGTGDYTVNFTTAMADVDYAPVAFAISLTLPYSVVGNQNYAQTTSSLRMRHVGWSGVSSDSAQTQDMSTVTVAVFGN